MTTTFTMQKEVVLALKIRLDQTSCNEDVYWTVLLHDQSCTAAYTSGTVRTNFFDIYIYMCVCVCTYTYTMFVVTRNKGVTGITV